MLLQDYQSIVLDPNYDMVRRQLPVSLFAEPKISSESSHLHVTGTPPELLRQQSQRVKRSFGLRCWPPNLGECLSNPYAIKPHYIVPGPYPPYTTGNGLSLDHLTNKRIKPHRLIKPV